MFKHVLVATDGSQLSGQAALNAVQLAKSMSAKLTAITVSTPFHVLATDAVMVTDTEEVYNDECEKRAGQYLGFVKAAAASSGINYQGKHVFTIIHISQSSMRRRTADATSSAWLRTGAEASLPSYWAAKR